MHENLERSRKSLKKKNTYCSSTKMKLKSSPCLVEKVVTVFFGGAISLISVSTVANRISTLLRYPFSSRKQYNRTH